MIWDGKFMQEVKCASSTQEPALHHASTQSVLFIN